MREHDSDLTIQHKGEPFGERIFVRGQQSLETTIGNLTPTLQSAAQASRRVGAARRLCIEDLHGVNATADANIVSERARTR